jgi:hypothetical protein
MSQSVFCILVSPRNISSNIQFYEMDRKKLCKMENIVLSLKKVHQNYFPFGREYWENYFNVEFRL